MKIKIILLTLFATPLWAKPTILISHFDAFGRSATNNSTTVAQMLAQTQIMQKFDVNFCLLNTVFDKSLYQLEECLHTMDKTPDLILALGEGTCDLKIETMARNLDRTKNPDNEGNERHNEVIIPNGPLVYGMNYPIAKMFCALDKKMQKNITLSNNPGTFVCNNLAYQFAYKNPHLNFGFIHVPTSACKNVSQKNKELVPKLVKMIEVGVKGAEKERFPTTKRELQIHRNSHQDNQCIQGFYKKIKGIDEKGFLRF